MPIESPSRRKLRREFRRKGYWAVYHQVSGYPPGKRELAHEWLRERERASDRRKRWYPAFDHRDWHGSGGRHLSRSLTIAIEMALEPQGRRARQGKAAHRPRTRHKSLAETVPRLIGPGRC